MWISRPIYELLPYLYMLVGAVLLAAAWLVEADTWPSVFFTVGALSLMGGLVLWLRERQSGPAPGQGAQAASARAA